MEMHTDSPPGDRLMAKLSDVGVIPDEEAVVRHGLLEDGYDLPELADTMEEADARATASTYLRVSGLIVREQLANSAEHRTLIAYYQRKHDERQHQLDSRINYLGGVLKRLFGFMTVTGKKKSLNLLGGRVGMRAKQDELVIDDDEAVITWAVNKGHASGLTNVKRTVDRKALRAYMEKPSQISGLPPGVSLKERPDEFYAKPVD